MTSTITLTANDLRVGYGSTIALEIPNLELHGRIIAVIGHNGSGKSTLIKSALQLLTPRAGRIDLRSAGSTAPLLPDKDMAFSPENGAVFSDIPVESYVRLWCRIKHNNPNYYRREGQAVIERLNISPLFRKLGRELSKGQRRRVQTAVGFLTNPRIFLFDEPFDGLDVLQSSLLSQIMLEESSRMGMIISSHRMDVVEQLADQVIVLKGGRVLAAGTVADACSALCPAQSQTTYSNGNGAAHKPSSLSLGAAMNYHLIHSPDTVVDSDL